MGHFEHAAKLDVDTFREGLDELQNMIKNQPDKTLYMYCTGGIRCDVTASYLRKNGINDFKMVNLNKMEMCTSGVKKKIKTKKRAYY